MLLLATISRRLDETRRHSLASGLFDSKRLLTMSQIAEDGAVGKASHTHRRGEEMNQQQLLERITVDPESFGGKPIVRGRRLAVEHILGMLAAGDTSETMLGPWLEREDVVPGPAGVGASSRRP